jgi:hypothetical protein
MHNYAAVIVSKDSGETRNRVDKRISEHAAGDCMHAVFPAPLRVHCQLLYPVSATVCRR